MLSHPLLLQWGAAMITSGELFLPFVAKWRSRRPGRSRPVATGLRRLVLPVVLLLSSFACAAAPADAEADMPEGLPAETANETEADAAAAAARSAAEDPEVIEQARRLRAASASVVGVRAVATPDARSSETLGPVREGSGVVIGSDGLVLTIGYLIMEAERVDVQTETGKVFPARVVAYDIATGFGLLQSVVPMNLQAAPLGSSASVDETEPYVVASGGDAGTLSLAQVVSRRPFSGYWEYHIDDALFTVPPRTDHSGAALFNQHGQLVGIGSLIVMEAGPPGLAQPGNMFVPIDLLKPVLPELRQRGASARSTRAWLGVNCIEQQGLVRVVRISEDSPAEAAGLRPGDLILKLDGLPIDSLETFYKKLWDNSAAEREVTIEVGRGPQVENVKARTIDRMKTLRRALGI
ncbi:S1C family serine protease [Caldimonas brevitalea]|uniref:Serine protease n=1 Tax=Caldimonas brevitalea TaxID=413882 RepID=A0A0G3BVL0_9BURK|nr:S1C family serine protease [Caldimonas brevitalea]AKJ30570.1 serine protease [Caldimonas brevitalea]